MSAPMPEYGCYHIQTFFAQNRKSFVNHYGKAIRAIHELPEIVLRTATGIDGKPFVTLKWTYLCLQCPHISTADGRDHHSTQKQHMFSVASANGFLYCKNCDDFVFDSNLEDIRLSKGEVSRKPEDTMSHEESRLVFANTTPLDCDIDGIRGLYNLGQSCYINALLQCFLHNPFLRSYFLSDQHHANSCDIEHCMSCALDDIFKDFYGTRKLEGVAPLKVLEVTWRQNSDLAGNRQQDAAEFMHHMKNSLCESSNVKDPDGSSPGSQAPNDNESDPDCSCPVHRTFQGRIHSNLRCDSCRNSTRNIETFTDLSLDLQSVREARKSKTTKSNKDKESGEKPSKKAKLEENEDPLTLHDCLMSYTAVEHISDSRCENCQSSGKTKQLSLHRLPPVLTLHLKRFEQLSATAAKIKDQVRFPMRLDLHPYSTESQRSRSVTPANDESGRSSPARNSATQFELTAVVVHIGSQLDQGHYIAYCRDPGLTHDNTWFKFDDEKVTVVSEKEVLAAQAYLLFYMVKELC